MELNTENSAIFSKVFPKELKSPIIQGVYPKLIKDCNRQKLRSWASFLIENWYHLEVVGKVPLKNGEKP